VEDLAGILLRASVIYLFMLLMLRLTGKRSIDTLSPMDFILGLVLGDTVDDLLWNEITMADGLTAIVTVLGLHVLLALATSRSRALNALISSLPTPVVKNGRFLQAGLDRERTRRDEVEADLRQHGEDSLKNVLFAQWEAGGRLSLQRKKEVKG
jgi:uncharacterized membrane protein YcaP (DUF421 family)